MYSDVTITCPNCGRSIERPARQCPLCGADVEWMLEERRVGAEYLRYFSAAVLGSIPLSIAVLMLAGMLTPFRAVLIPVWVSVASISGVLWLVSEHIDPNHTSKSDSK